MEMEILEEHPKRAKISKRKIYWDLAKAALDPNRPVLIQLVVTRRCNLACGYCFEYDKVSKPVPLAVLKARVDDCKRLKAVFVTLNGGEPLLHPQIVELVKYISDSGMIPMMNSNGHVLKPVLIKKLNRAGLFGMQISCDSLEDNEVTSKSMKRLRPKLDMLKEHAEFIVRINGVLGSGPPQEAVVVAKIVLGYGFDFQCSLVRDASGSADFLDPEAQAAYMEIRNLKGRLPAALNDNFQLPLVRGEDVNWKCRSGARHFEVDSDGLVHLCQPRTGMPAKKLADYNVDDIKQHFNSEKTCSKRCSVAYAHLGSRMDGFRPQNRRLNG